VVQVFSLGRATFRKRHRKQRRAGPVGYRRGISLAEVRHSSGKSDWSLDCLRHTAHKASDPSNEPLVDQRNCNTRSLRAGQCPGSLAVHPMAPSLAPSRNRIIPISCRNLLFLPCRPYIGRQTKPFGQQPRGLSARGAGERGHCEVAGRTER